MGEQSFADQHELQVQESSESTWLRWCPTSETLLRIAESRILNTIKTPFEGKYVNIPSGGKLDNQIWTLTFNKESDKLPLVLIHGFASGVGLWCLNLDAFAAQRPVYAFDLLGFGRSSRSVFSSNALEAERQFVQSIEEWRKQVGLEKFILLGHSFGGFLASAYSLQYPDRVSYLILADPWGFPSQPGKDETSTRIHIPFWVKWIFHLLQPFNPLGILRVAGPIGPRLVGLARSDLVQFFSNKIEGASMIIPEYIYHCNAQNPTGESAFHAMMANFGWAKYPMIHRLPALKSDIPITFIYGSRSWIDRKSGDCIKDLMKNSCINVHTLRRSGHQLYADNSEDFNSFVIKVSESAGPKPNLSNMTSDFQTNEISGKEKKIETTNEMLPFDETTFNSVKTSL